MIIPFSIASYKRADLPPVVLRNQFVEKTTDTPEKLVLLPRPGLTESKTLGTGPIRGLFQESGALSEAQFTVSGSQLFNGDSAIGGVAGSGLTQMAATLNTLLIATGSSFQASDGVTVTSVDFPNGYGVSSVANLGGYTLAAATDTRRIYFTLDPSTWDALDYISTTATTANIVGFAQLSDQLWVFTADRTYVFVLTGNSDTPIQAVPGRVFPRGCRSRDSIVLADNTVFWVGDDGIFYRADNAPLRVSDHGIEEMIAESDPADLACWTYPWIGHTMIVLHMTGGTRVYDAATQQWHEVGSYGRTRWRARIGLAQGQQVFAGDDETGQIWTLDASATSDDGAPLERTFTIILTERGFLDRLTLDCTTGVTGGAAQPAGTIELRTSRDSGASWSNWKQASLGQEGQYRAWPAWRSLGMVDEEGMVIQIRLTDSRPWRMSDPRVNDPAAGRSR
jgi:hypothetical protein